MQSVPVFTVPNSRSVARQQRKLAPRPSRRFQFHCLKRPLKLEQVPGTGRVDRTPSRCHWPGETSPGQTTETRRVPSTGPFYTTAVPVNYITPFSSSSTILIVESSSSTPSTSRPPDAPDCGSRSRKMYTVAMGFDRFF